MEVELIKMIALGVGWLRYLRVGFYLFFLINGWSLGMLTADNITIVFSQLMKSNNNSMYYIIIYSVLLQQPWFTSNT